MADKQVQDLAEVYGEQDIVNSAAQRLLEEGPRALAPLFIAKDIDKTYDADLERIQSRTADVLINVQVLEQVLTELKKQYQDTLQKM